MRTWKPEEFDEMCGGFIMISVAEANFKSKHQHEINNILGVIEKDMVQGCDAEEGDIR